MKQISRRNIDKLGRVVIPHEVREVIGLKKHDVFDIYKEGEYVVLEKQNKGCVFCESELGLIEYREKNVCGKCVKELKKPLEG